MKYLIFCLALTTTQVFSQSIDCKQLELLRQHKDSSRSITSRMTSFHSSDISDLENITETDSLHNSRTTLKSKDKKGFRVGEVFQYESISYKGILYSKQVNDSIWVYRLPEKPDSSTLKELEKYRNVQYNDCQKVGTETIEGKTYDIVETKMLIKSTYLDSILTMRMWVDFQSSIVKRTELKSFSSTTPLSQTHIVTDYYVDVPIVQKPENAISKEEKAERDLRMKKEKKERKTPEYKDFTLYSFISKNLKYPKTARDAKIEGTVFVKCTVEIDGSICDLSIQKGIGFDCDEAAIEVVKKTSGDWLPVMKFGKPVRGSTIVPVRFKL